MSVRRPRLKYFLSFLVVRLADAGWRSLAGPAWLLPGPGASGLPRAVTAPSSSSTELLHSTVSYRSSPVTPTHSRLRLINPISYRGSGVRSDRGRYWWAGLRTLVACFLRTRLFCHLWSRCGRDSEGEGPEEGKEELEKVTFVFCAVIAGADCSVAK